MCRRGYCDKADCRRDRPPSLQERRSAAPRCRPQRGRDSRPRHSHPKPLPSPYLQLPEDMGSGAAWGDYDGDGYPDLFVADIAAPLTASPEEMAAYPGGNRLYHNNRDGTFTDVSSQAGVGHKGICNGAAWADFDNDGKLDL